MKRLRLLSKHKNEILTKAGCLCNVCSKGVVRVCCSGFIESVDQMLHFSPANPIYLATAGMFDAVHSSTGLPWWFSIVIATFAMRTAVHLPLTVAAQKSQAKLIQLKPELEEEMKSVAGAVKHAKWVYKWDAAQYKRSFESSMKKGEKEFYEKHNVHPLKGAVVLLTQLPVWLTLSLSLRNMAGAYGLAAHHGFDTEGALWFADLTLRDPTLILPIILGVLTFLNIKIGRTVNPASSSLNAQMIRIEKKVRRVMVILPLVITLIAGTQPSGVVLYWVSSALFSLLQNLLFAVPAVRRRLGIPRVPNEPTIAKLFKS